MGHSNGKITAPVGLDSDVYPTLGIGATSNGYDLGYACANTHGKINNLIIGKLMMVYVV